MAARRLDGRVKRLKVLISAYACEPNKGSEPGIGWNVALEMAKYHDVWVLTRANNGEVIEAELSHRPVPGLTFAYYDLPRWARWWKQGGRGVQLYYYLWQLGAVSLLRNLHKQIAFDLAHHVTFVKYWSPAAACFLGVPFIWGPVGGGDATPRAFLSSSGGAGRRYEHVRSAARWLAERDPFVRLAARRSYLALATTPQTAIRLSRLGAGTARVLPAVGLRVAGANRGGGRVGASKPVIKFLSSGRLLALKGFHLGLQAFAASGLQDAEYWLVGDGPERSRLERLARDLGVAERVKVWGWLQRDEALAVLAECTALVHPSLHDSGGWVCLEAMAAGKPVICLDLGGPALQVTPETGFKVPAVSPEQAVADIAEAMRKVAADVELRSRMGAAGRDRVRSEFSWEHKGHVLNDYYHEVVAGSRR